MDEVAQKGTVAAWLGDLSEALAARDIPLAMSLFHDDCYWRDLLTFTWNIITLEGTDSVADMLAATLDRTRPHGWSLSSDTKTEGGVTEAWLTFETEVAHGAGIVRLKDGRCHTMFTMMRDLKGFEDPVGPRRPRGVRDGADTERETWTERRAREEARLGTTEQPYCVIIGGGQGGIALGARLRQLGVPAIIVEKNGRAGDSWRNRYRSLVLHDPVWYDHMPYLPFPENWPVFTPKDKMGDWLEMYVKVMELTYWTSTTCERASYDPDAGQWRVELDRDGEKVTLTPAHLVFATGAYGPPNRLELPGAEAFEGEVLHSCDYADGADYRGRRCAVIGAASSSHDVAVDLWENGAKPIMIQRAPTTVVKSETLREFGFANYSEEAVAAGLTTERADMLAASTPLALFAEKQKPVYRTIQERDADFYERLRAAGFAVDFGPDGTGLQVKAQRTGTGYYIDVGASELIATGEICVKSGAGVERLTRDGLELQDGDEILADVVIQCTGYQSMHEKVAELVSRQMADRLGPCWGLGSDTPKDPGPWQGELRNMWKPTAQPHLWFHGGNLALSRFYSKILALQLKARMESLATPVYRAPAPAQEA